MSSDKNFSPGMRGRKGNTFTEIFYVLLLRNRERAESSMFAASQLPSGQSNPYAKVAHFGIAYCDPL